jgi:hypothetical protein
MEKIIQAQQKLNQEISDIIDDEWKRLEKEKQDIKKEREDLKRKAAEWEALANKLTKVQKGGNR